MILYNRANCIKNSYLKLTVYGRLLLLLVTWNYNCLARLVGWVYGISTFVGNLMSNPFLYKLSVLFQTVQFSMGTQFNCQKHFYFKLFKFSQTILIQTIQFCININFFHTQLNVKTVLFQAIQFSISTQFSLLTVKLLQELLYNSSN